MNWYIVAQVASGMTPDNSDPSNPKWNGFDRQRQFPFMSDHSNPYQRTYKDPDAEMYGYEDDAPARQGGTLYHVTTNLAGIKASEQLKSRSQLGDTMGLGGGPQNEAANMISMTYDYSRAKHIYEEFQFVARVVRGIAKASDVYKHVSSYADAPDEGLSKLDRLLRAYGVPKKMILNGDDIHIGEILNREISSPQNAYEFFVECEQAVIEMEKPSDDFGTDSPYQQSVIGFTSPFAAVQGLNPSQIAIVQCVLRKDATLEHVTHEMEVRANPNDIAVVRYMQPSSGY